MDQLDTQLRKVEKAEACVIFAATAVAIISMWFLVYTVFYLV